MPTWLCPNPDLALETDREYLWKRSDGWRESDGGTNRWLWYVTPIGFNGSGGYWVRVRLVWERSGATHSTQCDSWTLEKSIEAELEIAALASPQAAAAVDPHATDSGKPTTRENSSDA